MRKVFLSFIMKETRHILRDRRTVLILFGMPVVMMLLFGFAISTDLREVRTAVVAAEPDDAVQRATDRVAASEYFDITHLVRTPAEAEALMRSGLVDVALVFSPGYADHRHDGTARIQMMTDASDPNTAISRSSYLAMILAQEAAANASAPAEIVTRMLYNPQMLSAYNFVPGTMGVILMLICAMMTSVSIAREKERGTLEVLLVSPIKPLHIMLAKAVPYMVLSLLILAAILLLSAFVLHVPVAGSLTAILGVSALYIVLSLALGLLISIAAPNQLTAMLVSAVVLLLPSLLLSGMIYPIDSMPAPLRALSFCIPARWYISAMRKLMIMGVDFSVVLGEVAVLGGITLVLLAVALKKFKTRME